MKPEIVGESSTSPTVNGETFSPQIAADANDCSTFDDLGDSDDDDVKTSKVIGKQDEKLSLSDSLSRANGYKDAGNSAFKRVEFIEAGRRYQEGISILNQFIKNAAEDESDDEVKSTLISLHGNNSMVLMKLENWNAAIVSTSEVLKAEKNNIKALFRRGVSYHKVGFLEESKADLTYLLELDAKNAAAIKELTQVIKDIKSSKIKEKVAFSNMFKKNIYGDKETERIAKEKRDEIEKERENDEWIKNKLSRRESGLEQLTFEDWKKEKKESEEKEVKELKARKEKIEKEKDDKLEYDRREKNRLEKKERELLAVDTSEDDDDYDEEDSKILSETKKKGYCYFRNEQSSEVKALIGDITPKAMLVTQPSAPNGVYNQIDEGMDIVEDGDVMKVSSWNHAGTWEEKDMTEFSKSRITSLCLDAEVHDVVPITVGKRVRAYVTGVKSVEGEAQIVMARGKKRYIYDFNVMLDIEIVVETVDLSPEMDDLNKVAPSSKKFKATLHLPEVSPNTLIESTIQFKKAIPVSLDHVVNSTVDSLRSQLHEKMTIFELEFKCL